MALKLTALMLHSVALTLSTQRMNLDSNSHIFYILSLFTFLDQQETQQENNRVYFACFTQGNFLNYSQRVKIGFYAI